MNKALIFILSASIFLSACSSKASPPTTSKSITSEDAHSNSTTEQLPSNSQTLETMIDADDFEITYYNYYTSIGTPYSILVLENKMDEGISLTIDSLEYDENNNIIGVGNDTVDYFKGNSQAVFTFIHDDMPYDMAIELSAEFIDNDTCISSDLTYEVSELDEKIILSITNNSDSIGRNVMCTILFFNDDTLVNVEERLTMDNDFELKPKDTVHKEFYSFSTYDRYEIYLTGQKL